MDFNISDDAKLILSYTEQEAWNLLASIRALPQEVAVLFRDLIGEERLSQHLETMAAPVATAAPVSAPEVEAIPEPAALEQDAPAANVEDVDHVEVQTEAPA